MTRNLLKVILEEVSLVDTPANKHAKVVLFKRGKKSKWDVSAFVDLCKSYEDPQEDFDDALAEEIERQTMREVEDKMWPLFSALRESVSTAMSELDGDARDAKVRENVESFLSQVEAITANLDSNPGDGSSSDPAGSTGSNPKGSDMTPEELTKKLGELETQVAELTKAKDTAEEALKGAVSLDVLTKANQAAGLDATITVAKDGSVTVEKKEAKDDDYIEMGGERILKSSVPAGVLKAMQKQEEDLASLKKSQQEVNLSKRGKDELPNLAGSDVQKGRLLEAVDGIADEDDRKAVTEALKAADAAVSKVFDTFGRQADDDGDAADAEAKLDKLTKGIQKEDPDLSYEQAYSQVLKSKEGKALRREMLDAERSAH